MYGIPIHFHKENHHTQNPNFAHLVPATHAHFSPAHPVSVAAVNHSAFATAPHHHIAQHHTTHSVFPNNLHPGPHFYHGPNVAMNPGSITPSGSHPMAGYAEGGVVMSTTIPAGMVVEKMQTMHIHNSSHKVISMGKSVQHQSSSGGEDSSIADKKKKLLAQNGLVPTGSSSSGVSSNDDSSPKSAKKQKESNSHVSHSHHRRSLSDTSSTQSSTHHNKNIVITAHAAPSEKSHGSCKASNLTIDENNSEALKSSEIQCDARCHHKCLIGKDCPRHGAKILAKLKRRAEKEQRLKRHNQLEKVITGHPSIGLSQGNNTKHHKHSNVQYGHHVTTQPPPAKPPPIKSVVPPSVPKDQQNGAHAFREVIFVDSPTTMPGTAKKHFYERYKLFNVIGIGGGGTVYAGRRNEDNAPIAVKRVMRAKVKRWEKTRDGRTVPQEIALMIRCSGHIGIITLYDWFESVDSFVLILERPENSIDLFDYIRENGPLSENQARHIFSHVIAAIRHIHSCGIVHRDIKDENVILDRHTGYVKLIDFGCGTNLKDGPYTEFSGTAEFYPPEWFNQRRYWAKTMTVWSMGVLLFDMLQGEIPFKNSDRILENRPLFKEPVSSSARSLIRWMLSNDQKKRPTLMQVLDHAWMKACNNYQPITSL